MSPARVPMRILLAADGSEYTRKAARQLVKYTKFLAEAPEVHLLYVHAALPYKRAMAIVGKAAVEKYQREESEAALDVAEKELEKAGLGFTSHWRVGDVAEQIAAFVKDNGIDLIVMGSHGNTALKSLALGSVTTRVIAMMKAPVLIVR
jgi:nucleotide-binding universal stress UspA family protein